MSLAVVYSRANLGITARLVEVEVHLSYGFAGLHIVGLPEAVVKESKDRVRSAIINSQFEFPTKRITINLAPADLPKEDGRYDLAIALGILAASEQIPATALVHYEFGGELALSGELRPFRGVLPMMIAARNANRALVLPILNAVEAGYVENANIYVANDLLAVCQHLQGRNLLARYTPPPKEDTSTTPLDLSDICGQYRAKRALEIAAAGGHSLLMKGPPGSGKTMLANRLPSILPELTTEEMLEIASIYSLQAQREPDMAYLRRPFRSPHHSASSVALVGGGRHPRPGEVSLAHRGILFLDELPEFNRMSLEALREPMEAGVVTISRAAYSIQYPAQFQLIAAMNPCPCGYWRDGTTRCHCSPDQVTRYQKRLSGPFLDRIDLFVETSPVNPVMLLNFEKEHRLTSREVKQKVVQAHRLQYERAGCLNSVMSNDMLNKSCQLEIEDRKELQIIIHRMGLSARAYHRLLKVARTVADLAASATIQREHWQEVLLFKA